MLAKQLNYLSRGFLEYTRELLRSRQVIMDLTRREFRSRYLGSAFGLLWAFVHPTVMLLIYSIVFPILGAGPVGGLPYIVFLMSGLVPWFLVQDYICAASGVIIDNRFLVKKVVFRISLLPVVRLLSFLPVHLFFVVCVILVCWLKGYPPSWYNLQIIYYLAALLVLAMGWSWLVSALTPFLKDLGQFVQVLNQIFFWLTAIIWPVQKARDAHLLWLLDLNPLVYIVEGYRDAMVQHVWFWQHPLQTVYYWLVATFFFAVGGMVFLRLQPDFADVL